MNKKADTMTRRDFFKAAFKRAVAEVKEGYREGLAAQTNAAALKQKSAAPG